MKTKDILEILKKLFFNLKFHPRFIKELQKLLKNEPKTF